VYPERENKVILPLLLLEMWAPCKARWVYAGAVVFASARCSLQFAKASAATLPQQKKNNSTELHRGRVNISGFICTVARECSRRRTFDKYLGLGLRQRCRGKPCGGMLGATVRMARFFIGSSNIFEKRIGLKSGSSTPPPRKHHRIPKFYVRPAVSAGSPM
jgi:hypothetical protein